MQLGHKIAMMRNNKKISQRTLANDLNLSPSVVGMWETNKRMPSLDNFIDIIDYFSISADVLLEDDRKLKPEEYKTDVEISPSIKKILETFNSLNEDNQDILIGEAKKLLINQRLNEKKEYTHPIAKAT